MVASPHQPERRARPAPEMRRVSRHPAAQPPRRDWGAEDYADPSHDERDLQQRLHRRRRGGVLPGILMGGAAVLALAGGVYLFGGGRSSGPVTGTPPSAPPVASAPLAPTVPASPGVTAAPSRPPAPVAPPPPEPPRQQAVAPEPVPPPVTSPPVAAPAPTARPVETPPPPREEPPRAAAPAPSPPPVPAPATRAGPSAAEIAALLAKGRELIGVGDIGGARLVIERAATGDDPGALFALAETYDPAALARWRVRGVRADAERARTLYRRALERGAPQAQERIDALR